MRRRSERGQTLVEFALILPITLTLIVGLFDLTRFVFTSVTLSNAVREGSRYAVTHGAESSAPADLAAITTVVQAAAVGVPSPTVTATWPSGNAYRGSDVVVGATYLFTPILGQVFLGNGLSITQSASSSLAIQF